MKSFKLNFRQTELLTATLLVLLWALSSGGKVSDLTTFKRELSAQVFSDRFTDFLFYVIPTGEVIVALLLVYGRTRLTGFIFSFSILTIFTGYISLVLLSVFSKVPCACISLIPNMGFTFHLFFNLFFMAVSAIGIIVTKKERRNKGMDKILSHAPLTA